MPDDIPVIGGSMTQEAGYHAFGFCGHGFQLSPIVGKLLAELIVDGKPSIPLMPFPFPALVESKTITSIDPWPKFR